MPKTLMFIEKSLEPQIIQITVPDVMGPGDAVAPALPGHYLAALGDSPVDEIIVSAPAPAVISDLPDQLLSLDVTANSAPMEIDLYTVFSPPAGLTFTLTGAAPPAGTTIVDNILSIPRTALYAPTTIGIQAEDSLDRTAASDVLVTVASVPGIMAAPTVTPITATQASVVFGPAPASNNSPIDHYDITYSVVGSGTFTTVTALTPGTITLGGIPAGAEFDTTVRAVNAIGPGPVSLPTRADLPAPSASIGFTSSDGHYIEIDNPAGFLSTNTTFVDPSLITITQTVPSVSDTGVTNTRTLSHLAGFRADIVGAKLRLWCRGCLSDLATSISLTINAGALTNGASTNTLITGAIEPRTSYRVYRPKGRLAGVVTGKYDLVMEHGVVATPFWVEGQGFAPNGCLVKFAVTDGTVTQDRFAIQQTRSRYCDYILFGYAARDNRDEANPTHDELKALAEPQWLKNAANSGNSALGGVGVMSHATAFNPADFAVGALTVTMTVYSHAGGEQSAVSESWKIYNNRDGSYTFRDRYVSVTGSDTTGNGTLGNPYATIGRAIVEAGSPALGCLPTHMPRVMLIGSGNPAAPATYIMSDVTVDDANRPGTTDTYLTIQAAPGHSWQDVKIRQQKNKVNLRTRRMRFLDLHFYIDGANGWDAYVMFDPSTTSFPTATNPQTYLFDKCTVSHSLTRDGHIYSASPLAIGESFKNINVHWTNHINRDMYRKGHTVYSEGSMRNAAILRTTDDTIIGPKCLMMSIFCFDNAQSPNNMALNDVEGTIVAGGTIVGAYSGQTATVASYNAVVAGGSTKHRLILSGRSGSFKPDDNTKHHAVVVANPGAFVAGSPITVSTSSGVSRNLLRVDGNILRIARSGSETSIAASGVTISQASTGATSLTTSASSLVGSIIFSNGATGNYSASHPDAIQVAATRPHRIIVTPVSGPLTVGDTVRKNGTTSIIQAVDNIPGFGTALTIGGTGSVVWFGGDTNKNFATGLGSVFTFHYVYDVSPYDVPENLFVCNVLFNYIEGAPIFVENGLKNLHFALVHYISNDGTRENAWQFSRTQDVSFLAISAPQRPCWDRLPDESGPRGGIVSIGLVAEEVDGAYAGQWMVGCHGVQAGQTNAFQDVTTGAYTMVDHVGHDDDATGFGQYAPIPVLPNIRRVNYGPQLRFDLFGNARPTDGTAAIGAVEEWIATAAPAVAPTLVASDSAAATNVAMPAGQLAGHLAVLVVGRADAGGFVTPAGWTLSDSRTISGGGSVAMFERLTTANAETTPTVTGAAWSGISVWRYAAGVGATVTADALSNTNPSFGALTAQGGTKPSALAVVFARSGGAGSAMQPPTGYTLASGAGNVNGRRMFYDEDSTLAATTSATLVAGSTTAVTIHAEIMAAT